MTNRLGMGHPAIHSQAAPIVNRYSRQLNTGLQWLISLDISSTLDRALRPSCGYQTTKESRVTCSQTPRPKQPLHPLPTHSGPTPRRCMAVFPGPKIAKWSSLRASELVIQSSESVRQSIRLLRRHTEPQTGCKDAQGSTQRDKTSSEGCWRYQA